MRKNILVIMSPGGEFSSYLKKGDLERPLRFISNYSENYENIFYVSSDSKSFSKTINKKLKKKNVFHITNFGISSKNKLLRYITYAFFLPFRIIKNVDDVSVIRCYDIYSGIPAIITRKLMKKNINIILSWQYKWSKFKQYNYNTSHKNRIKRLLFKRLTNSIESFVLKRCDYVFVTTESLKKSAINIGVKEKRIFLLPNGLDFKIYPDMKERERVSFRKRLGFSKDDKVFVFVGQIIERKGFPFLVDIFNQAGKKLMVIGEGPLLDKMKLIGNRNIKFMGSIKNRNLYKYLGSSYAFIFPTELEGHPNVILEAWKMGLPIITTGTEGMELVRDGYTGLVAKKNKNDFINAIKHISSNDKTYKAIKNNCLKEVKKYDWEKISKHEIEVLKKIGV
jgi:glycosyltransferase involved in cell wall biosynthesis